jgi:hypothetical protein
MKTQNHQRLKEQTSFSAEDEHVEHSCPIPSDAMSILRKDEFVKTVLANDPDALKESPQNLFEASTVHLHSATENDLVVIAEGPLVGGNVTTFWVFQQAPTGMKLVVGNAHTHDLEILRTRTLGYRDIKLTGATAVEYTETILHFDGTRYKEFSSKTRPIK